MNTTTFALLASSLAFCVGCASTNQPHSGSGMTAVDPDRRAISAVLDDFHAAASKADGERYFAHFAPDAVFLGTDDTERWTVSQFRAYADPHFSKGQGWTYTTATRFISLAPDGRSAWFDEQLDNAKYGRCRGSGILVKHEGAWRIAQYNLTVPIPNDLLPEVAQRIREHQSQALPN